jgi:tryptophanyl-tRNA synthetase
MKNIILTGDRPTGRLHIGHFVGSLRERVNLQNEGNYEAMYVMIADTQALTDNYGNPEKVRNNIIEVMLDYLSVGLDPKKVHFFIQSEVNALPELTMYYMNLVTLPRLLRNPTVKSETKMRGFDDTQGIPVGFANYPISQASDITAFKANIIPVGDDQLPMIEQAREIVKSFNNTYSDVLVLPNALLPKNEVCLRLPGLDGNNKMSKSLGNCIYLTDDEVTLKNKVRSMYTDPTHLKVSDPGHIKGNIVFTYLEAFVSDDDFVKYLPDYKNLDDLKKHYEQGGVGDSLIKNFLYEVLNAVLSPIRERRHYYEKHIDDVYNYLIDGTKKANEAANETLLEVKQAMGLNYFNDPKYLEELKSKYN